MEYDERNWFEWYPVQLGDTLTEISLWWFANASSWRRIWLANRRFIPDPDRIREGQWLRLPYDEVRYHMERGDTLFQLAEWVYGDGNQWGRIQDANLWIEDPNRIPVGWRIWIP